METSSIAQSPRRIQHLVDAKAAGSDVRLEVVFEILPVDFHHRTNPFHAYIFLAKYLGTVDGEAFEFRKCYARGCPNNLCTHVSLAVNIANRYLQRDYHTLETGGIVLEKKLFTLDHMIIKFESLEKQGPPALTIPDLSGLAKGGKKVDVRVDLEMIPAVEHFSDQTNAQTFLSGEFLAKTADGSFLCHRCFACFTTDREAEEKETAVKVANARLALIYSDFEKNGVTCRPQYFK